MRKILLLLSVVLLAAVAGVCVYAQSSESMSTVRFTVSADKNVTQEIKLYKDRSVYYAFLPSYADLENCSIEYSGGRLYIDGEYLRPSSTCKDLKLNKKYTVVSKNILGSKTSEDKLIIMKGSGIPALSLTLSDGSIDEINADKEVRKKGFASLIKENGEVNFYGSVRDMHGRGNTTWAQKKKSYAVELEKAADLLGMGEGRNWVLLSDSFDESGLRNKLAYETAKALGVEFTPDCEYIDLYVDNSYLGMYLLAERIETGEGRVDIRDLGEETQRLNSDSLYTYKTFDETDGGKIKRGFEIPVNPDDITGGYLVQTEYHKSAVKLEKNYFTTDFLSISVASPKYASRQQIDYISSCFEKTEKEIVNGDLSGIDVDSFAKYYLIQEFFANTDDSSYYYYKNSDSSDGKIHACSIWDFDLSIGNSWLVPDVNPEYLYRNKNNWYGTLYKNPEFKSALKKYYRDGLLSVIDDTVYAQPAVSGSFDMNKRRWREVSGKGKEADKSQLHFNSLDQHIDYVKKFLEKREKFLTSAWIDEDEYHFAFFSSSDYRQGFAVKAGDTLDEMPDPESKETKGNRFLGWYDSDGNKYIQGQELKEDKRYTARWKKKAPAKNAAKPDKNSFENKSGDGMSKLTIIGLIIILGASAAFITGDMLYAFREKKRRNKDG